MRKTSHYAPSCAWARMSTVWHFAGVEPDRERRLTAGMRHYLERLRPLFTKGGRFEKYFAVFEMVDTFLYSPPDTTRTAPHVRDGIDLKRLMMYVVVALIPCILWSWFNTGYQANLALAQMGTVKGGWRGELLGHSISGLMPAVLFPTRYMASCIFCRSIWWLLIVGGCGKHCSPRCVERDQRRPSGHIHTLHTDAATGHASLDGRTRDQLRCGDRQRDFRRDRQEFSQSGPDRACVSLLRLSRRN
jgi:hypothetical protein